MRERQFIYNIIFGIILISGIVVIFPSIDLYFSNLFYTQERGFFLKDFTLIKVIYSFVPYLTYTIILFLFITALWEHKLLKKAHLLYIITCLVFGPGIVVNFILKDNFGRARPSQVIEFDGSKSFTPVNVISNQCHKNCSFVSGHAAIGFFLSAFSYTILVYRLKIILISLSLGFLIGLTRVMQGGHFLSDIIFSALFTNIINYLLFLYFRNKFDSSNEI